MVRYEAAAHCLNLTASRTGFDRIEGAGMRLYRDGKLIDRNEQGLKDAAELVRQFRDSGLLSWRNLGALE
jgi:hypothetical protein